MHSKQVDSERMISHLQKYLNPANTTRKPHELTLRLVTATLLIDLLNNDRFLCLYAIKIHFSR